MSHTHDQTNPVPTHDHGHDHHHDNQHTHHRHHAHHPPPEPEIPSYEMANRDHFNATAHTYDERPDAQWRADAIGHAMRKTGLFKQGVTTVMDFACGTGLISRALAAEDPKSIVGVDISQAMVDRYNQVVSDHGISSQEMRAVCVDPSANLKHTLQGMGIAGFDVVVCASSYHHFTDIDEVTRSLVACLNPGGSLFVADLVHSANTHEVFRQDVRHIVAHKGGFSEEDMRLTFERAGLTNFTFEVIAEAKRAGHALAMFLARGNTVQ